MIRILKLNVFKVLTHLSFLTLFFAAKLQRFFCFKKKMFDLRNGQSLMSGQALVSNDGRFKLCMQEDGNLVIYLLSDPIWASQTDNKGSAPFKLVMQEDNHLCIYDTYGNCTWANGMHGKGRGKVSARMQDDGNFVVYDENEDAVWCTRTDGGHQADGKYQGCGHKLM